MTIHKLFKELQKLSEEDRELLNESIREYLNVKRICSNLGIKYNDKMLLKQIENTQNYRLVTPKATGISPNQVTPNSTPDPVTEKMKQIVIGTNLDQIEEAAEKKGLV